MSEDNKTRRRSKAGRQKKQVAASLVSPEKTVVENNEVNPSTILPSIDEIILEDENVSSNEEPELKS